MHGRWWTTAACLLLGGCVLQEDYDRLARTQELQAEEARSLKRQVAERDKEFSRQAASELALRKQISKLNERLGALREENRRLQDRVASAERATDASDKRRKTLGADHARELAEAKRANARVLAERDAEIGKLNERIRQLQAVLARSRTAGTPPATSQPK